jgi:hypothetical protein
MINLDFEHIRDSPKVNTFCTITSDKVYSYFLFLEQTTMNDIAESEVLNALRGV